MNEESPHNMSTHDATHHHRLFTKTKTPHGERLELAAANGNAKQVARMLARDDAESSVPEQQAIRAHHVKNAFRAAVLGDFIECAQLLLPVKRQRSGLLVVLVFPEPLRVIDHNELASAAGLAAQHESFTVLAWLLALPDLKASNISMAYVKSPRAWRMIQKACDLQQQQQRQRKRKRQ